MAASCAPCGHVLESDLDRAARSHRRIKWIAGAIVFLLTVTAAADVVEYAPIDESPSQQDARPRVGTTCFGEAIPSLGDLPPHYGVLPLRPQNADNLLSVAPPQTQANDTAPHGAALNSTDVNFTTGAVSLASRRTRDAELREPQVVPLRNPALPEPTTLLLIGMGGALLVRRRRR